MRRFGSLMACSNKAPKMSKVVVITGSEGGIGKALVKAYLDDNYFVIGLTLNKRS